MPKPSRGPVRNPRPRAPRRRATLALGAAALLASAAHAQLLNLDAPAGAPQGVGPAAAALAGELQARITADQAAAESDPRARALTALRALARALILRGEDLGEPGAPHTLAGRTLAARLPALEALLAALPPDDPAVHLLAADAERAARSIPADVAAMDRLLRDTFATLLQRLDPPAAPVAWVPAPDAPEPVDPDAFDAALRAWPTRPGVTPEAAAALTEIAESLRAADSWHAYRPSAQRLRRLLRDAARTFDPDAPAAAITDDPVRTQFAMTFSAAVERLRDADTQRDALDALERLAGAHDALELLATLERRPDRARRQAAVTGAVVQALAAPPTNRVEAERRLAAVLRTLRMIHAAERPADDARLVRQLRPAHRALATSARRSAGPLFDALPRFAQDPDALTDPGILSALAAHSATLDDLALVERLSALLAAAPLDAASGPAVPRDMDRVADRLLALGQQLHRPEARDAALAELRAFGRAFLRLHQLPGEPSLARAAEPGAASANDVARWRDLTGSMHPQLAAAIRDERTRWLDAWAAADTPRAGGHAARLDSLHTLMGLLDAARLFGGSSAAAAPAPPRINAWPGWELSPEALSALVDDLRPSLPDAAAVALANDAAAATRRIADLAEAHPTLLLLAALERSALARGVAPPDPASAGLWELAAGSPPGRHAWLAPRRAELAALARAAEEWAAASRLSDRATAERWAEHLRAASAELLRSLPPE